MSMARLQKLMLQRQDASALNHKLAREEAAELERDPQTEAYLDRRRKRAEAKLARMDKRKQMQDPLTSSNEPKSYTLAEIEQWEARQEERMERQNRQFFDHASMALRQYERLTARLDPQAVLARQGDLERGVQALKKEVEDEDDRLSGKRRRRRQFEEDDDGLVTFVNEHNARFNAMAAKAYDKYVTEIRDSLQ